MTFLIDTQCWLWALEDPARLTKASRDLMEDPENTVLLSAASVWEIVIKVALGKLRLPTSPGEFVPARMREEAFTELPIEMRHALAVHDLPDHHKDPFDRMLVAQAMAENVPIMTSDRQLEAYPVRILRA